MKFENTKVYNFEGAIRGARNPLESWSKSDSTFDIPPQGKTILGKNDLGLMQRLIKAAVHDGHESHNKFMRQIMVCVDITAPMYFMAEFDTYKVGVTRNSSSFMHKGTSKEFEIEDFEVEDNRIVEILTKKTSNQTEKIFYPYETDEYKLYRCENGREYEVYKNGRIFSLPFTYTDTLGRSRSFPKREVSPSLTKNGYWEINIGGRNGERWLLHRLVAYLWIDNPNQYDTVDHINCNKNDNSAENLEWVTREENIKRECNNCLMRNNNIFADYLNWKQSSKIDLLKKDQIKRLKKAGMKQSDISSLMDVSQSQVSVVLRDDINTSQNKDLFEQCLVWEVLLIQLNELREKYLDTKDYYYFKEIRRLLPSSYLYKSTITMSYENIRNMYFQRRNHKLTEWSGSFIDWVKSLPYAEELIMYKGE